MQGTLDLFKLKLSPDNTMFFANTTDQQAFFDDNVALSIPNISFNGSRPFRFSANYIDATFNNYTYCRYKFGSKTVYAFIDNITFLNDNTCEIEVSIDLLQTFMVDIFNGVAKSNVSNQTLKDEDFNVYRPFTNKMTPSDFNSYLLKRLNKSITDTRIGGFILLNVDPNIMNKAGETSGTNFALYGLDDNGVPTSAMCLALPVEYNLETNTINTPQFYKLGSASSEVMCAGGGNLFNFLDAYASYVVDGCIGITFDQLLPDLYFNADDSIHYDTTNMQLVKLPNVSLDVPYLCIKNNSIANNWSIDLSDYLEDIPLPLRRNPYVYIRVGNDSESIELNLLDFYNDSPVTETMILEIEQFTSCLYPFQTNLKFKYNGREITDRNAIFNIVATDPVPFSISAWQEYYSNNKATVNDGLETQQKYQSAQLRNNLGTGLVNAGIDTIVGGVSWTKKLGQLSARSFKSQQNLFTAGVSGATGFLGAMTNYANGKLEMAKDKALQQIGWNDVKSSPSAFSNITSNLSSKYRNGTQGIEVDIYIAKNIEDIKAYHKQYGYVINRMQSSPLQNIHKHTNFDFISFNEITLGLLLPQNMVSLIEEQLESGVRFWYDYDNFLNYDIANNEYTNTGGA